MTEGAIAPGFEPVRDTFAALWEDIEVGAALSITIGGDTVVELWGGHADRAQTIPWNQRTLVNTYSITKGIVSIAIAQLVDQGLLDYQRPVADYWPAFGAENKYGITVAQALSHQAGLYTFAPGTEVSDLYDWQRITFGLASQKPAWEPGTAFGYHAITWGYIAGELIRQVSGKSAGQYIREHITAPIGADFHLGLPETELDRCAEMIGPNHARKPLAPVPASNSDKLSGHDPVLAPYRHISSREWRLAEVPASNGHATASGLTGCYQAVLSGKLLSAGALIRANAEQTSGQRDLCLGQHLRRSMGFLLNSADCYFGPGERAFGHPGTGGSTAFADPDHQVAFAYVTNQLHVSGSLRYKKLIDAFYGCL